jgi:hypothetical protein
MNINTESLKTYDALKGRLVSLVGNETILQLAKDGICPHYRLINPISKEEMYLFISNEVNNWIEYTYLIEMKGDTQKTLNFNVFNENINICNDFDMPKELHKITDIYRLPIETMYTPSGIYFLCLDDKIQYIGQSVNILGRVVTHSIEQKKLFNRVYYIKCPVNQLTRVEESLIRFLKPPLNGNLLKDGNRNHINVAKSILNFQD